MGKVFKNIEILNKKEKFQTLFIMQSDAGFSYRDKENIRVYNKKSNVKKIYKILNIVHFFNSYKNNECNVDKKNKFFNYNKSNYIKFF